MLWQRNSHCAGFARSGLYLDDFEVLDQWEKGGSENDIFNL